jgi:hypothetical protein
LLEKSIAALSGRARAAALCAKVNHRLLQSRPQSVPNFRVLPRTANKSEFVRPFRHSAGSRCPSCTAISMRCSSLLRLQQQIAGGSIQFVVSFQLLLLPTDLRALAWAVRFSKSAPAKLFWGGSDGGGVEPSARLGVGARRFGHLDVRAKPVPRRDLSFYSAEIADVRRQPLPEQNACERRPRALSQHCPNSRIETDAGRRSR